jgi:hypothetical protein
MRLQKVISKKTFFLNCFCWHLEGQIRNPNPDPYTHPDLNPDPLVRGMDLRIRIHTKMSWIRNAAKFYVSHAYNLLHSQYRPKLCLPPTLCTDLPSTNGAYTVQYLDWSTFTKLYSLLHNFACQCDQQTQFTDSRN